MHWLNEQEELVLRKTDIYAWAMAFRPEKEELMSNTGVTDEG